MCKTVELLNNEIEVVEYVNYQTGEKLNLERVKELKDKSMLKSKPDLWIEWDFETNNKLGLDIWNITRGSNKKAWWNCLKCKSSYDSFIYSRINNRKCSYCAGKKVNHTNSLETKFPKISMQWHPTLNGDLIPSRITYASNKKVWWFCDVCKMSYETRVIDKVSSEGCPYCSGHRTLLENSLFIKNPKLASEWHPTRNNNLTSQDVTANSNKKVWWLGECGHEWDAKISNRNRGFKCPYCAGQKAWKGETDMWTTNPKLASLLLNPEDGYRYKQNSNKKVDWKCLNCGEIIRDKKIDDVNNTRLPCPTCGRGKSMSEKMVRFLLNTINVEYINDRPFSWSKNKRYDFYIPSLNLIIETHGGQHYFRGFESLRGVSLKDIQDNDQYKYELAIANGIKPENYIVVDCRYSDFEFIKGNILNSKLADLFDLSNVDWINMKEEYYIPTIVEILKLWNEGITNSRVIADQLNIGSSTVRNHIRNLRKQNRLS